MNHYRHDPKCVDEYQVLLVECHISFIQLLKMTKLLWIQL